MYRNALQNIEKLLGHGGMSPEPVKTNSLVRPPQLDAPRYDPNEFVNSAVQNINEASQANRQARASDSSSPVPKSKAEAFLEGFGEGLSREEYPDLIEETTDEGVQVTTNAARYGLVDRPPARSSTPTGSRKEFVAAMMPYALKAAEETGLDPRIIIAQAAQETGWGRSAPNNNYFGIKSHGKAGGSSQTTHEYVNGKRITVKDDFRGYRDMGESVQGYVEFLRTNPRYSDMLSASTLDEQLSALGKSGYATDPNYARSVGSIARSIEL